MYTTTTIPYYIGWITPDALMLRGICTGPVITYQVSFREVLEILEGIPAISPISDLGDGSE
jgi:hypothetical protein